MLERLGNGLDNSDSKYQHTEFEDIIDTLVGPL